jgi:branched-chain amino acid transport system permease protein
MSWVLSDYVFNMAIMTLLWAGMSGAWNIMAGYGGLVSLGHAAFFGIGAYATASAYALFGLSPWIGMLIGVALATTLGVTVSWPCFRLKGAFFSLATMVFPIAIEIVANNWPELTRGPSGIAVPFKVGLANFSFDSKWPYLAAVTVYAGSIYLFTRWLDRGRLGLSLMAIRDDQVAGESLGVRPLRVKLTATAISTALTALGGFFYAQYIFFIDPPSVFSLNVSVQIALLSIIGGLGTPLGPLVGALVMIPLDGLLSQVFGGGPRLLVYGLLLLMAVLIAPQGIVGTIARWREKPA